MKTAAKRVVLAPVLAIALIGAAATGEAFAAKAGPVTKKCGMLKQKAAKQRCLKQNQANRVAFNQIKNSRFEGTRGDGEAVNSVYCANGKFESRTSGSYGTGISTGKRWMIDEAVVRQGGKWIDAFLKDGDGYEVAIQRRGSQWKLGVARLGRNLYPGDMEKTHAAGDCAKLVV